MMAEAATVLGAHGQVHALTYDTANGLAFAKQLAGQINAGVLNGTIRSAENDTAPTVAGGHNEFVATTDGETRLPAHYDVVVLDTGNATVHGSSASGQSVLGGMVSATYLNDKVSASGSIAFGGGNHSVRIGPSNTGAWYISVGDGNDTIDVLGSGAHTIMAGGGNDYIQLGKGTDVVNVTGNATIVGGDGKETLFGGSGATLTFVGGSGDASVTGGPGGHNFFTAGTGNETLVGGDTNNTGQDVFTFIKDHAGGQDLVERFSANDIVKLRGYSSDDVANALKHQSVGPNGVSIILSDNTKITFADVTKLDPNSFH